MGMVHHATYVNYFEIGRTELFRSQGGNYREFESRGLYFVVVSLECQYIEPARYDDLLSVRTRLARMTPAKLQHEYEVSRDGRPLVTGRTVLACVDQQGRVQRITEQLLFEDSAKAGRNET